MHNVITSLKRCSIELYIIDDKLPVFKSAKTVKFM